MFYQMHPSIDCSDGRATRLHFATAGVLFFKRAILVIFTFSRDHSSFTLNDTRIFADSY